MTRHVFFQQRSHLNCVSASYRITSLMSPYRWCMCVLWIMLLNSNLAITEMRIPSSSSDWSALVVDDRFQRKLRNGLFERDLRLTLADDDWLRVREESPFCGVDGSDDRALSSAEVWVSSILHFGLMSTMRFMINIHRKFHIHSLLFP